MRDSESGAPRLVLGPLLRYADETAATIWVETDRSCQVEILGHQARTFEVTGHHYALVVVDGLRPGAEYEYQVALDGTVRWPEPGSEFPPSVLRTVNPGRPFRLVFGSCRIAELRAPRHSRARARHDAEHGADALDGYALDLRETPRERWPDVILMIGDQVYADEVGPATRQFIRARRDLSEPPGDQVADFAEYCFLYREAWSGPSVRWLLSVIPTAMIFDDHDVHDDWNTSAAWLREYRAKPWWQARISGAYMSYWIYQHLGNLSPDELGRDELWRQVQQPGDASAVLRDFAARAERQSPGIQWSFRRSFGGVRVVVIDSRSGRVLEDGRRLMVSEADWRWVTGSVSGDWEHVVLATSLPLLLPAGIHALEAWNEAVCGGAWGKRAARLGERARRAADLEHWAAFGTSFAAFERLLTGLATGAYGRPPASITVISGDIHHSYLAAVDLPREADAPGAIGERSAVYQAVCSPIHNRLPDSLRRGQQLTTSWAGELAGRVLARLAGVTKPELRWRITRGPWFHNMLGILEFEGRRARIRFERTAADTTQAPRLQPVGETELAGFMIAKSSPSGQTVTSSRSPRGLDEADEGVAEAAFEAWVLVRSVACTSTATIPVRPPVAGTNLIVRRLKATATSTARTSALTLRLAWGGGMSSQNHAWRGRNASSSSSTATTRGCSWMMSGPIAWVSTAIRTPCSAARSFTPSSDGTWVDSTQPDEPPTRPSHRAME